MNFSGRIALVTGGTRGIGLAIARRLSDDGASVAILARDAGRLAVVEHTIGGPDRPVIGLRADVTDPAQVQEAVAAVVDRWDRIDILVNNAGGVGRSAPTAELADADWLETLAVILPGASTASGPCCPPCRPNGTDASSTSRVSSGRKVPPIWPPTPGSAGRGRVLCGSSTLPGPPGADAPTSGRVATPARALAAPHEVRTMRKPLQRATRSRRRSRVSRVTPAQVRAWLDDRFTAEPDLLQRIGRVLAALQKAEAAPARRPSRARRKVS